MPRPFRLQTVVRLREARRDAARAQLADALRAAEVLDGRRKQLEERFGELMDQRRRASASADTAWLLNAGRYELVLRSDEKELATNVKAIELEIDRRRAALSEAEQEVRALELLRERAEREQRAEETKREARRLDEFASMRAHAARVSNITLT